MLNPENFPQGFAIFIPFVILGFFLWIGGWRHYEYKPPTDEEMDSWEKWELQFRDGGYRHGR